MGRPRVVSPQKIGSRDGFSRDVVDLIQSVWRIISVQFTYYSKDVIL